jgi:hypothetical protein
MKMMIIMMNITKSKESEGNGERSVKKGDKEKRRGG